MTPLESVTLEPPTLAEIEAARRRIRNVAVRTPLVRFHAGDEGTEIYLKLETLQPIGSFKIRGAANAMLSASRSDLANGVLTASAGNMAQGVAWNARALSIPCTVVVPDHAAQTKLSALERLGARIVSVSYDDWWTVLTERKYPGHDGLFIHPVSDRAVIAGNGTIGLEILEDLPEVDAVYVPFGGGGLSSGIASAIRAIKPGVPVYGCEIATAAPLTASFDAGSPQAVRPTPSFVDALGGKSVLAEMWPLIRVLLSGAKVVELREVSDAIRLLAERVRVIAEGAGAVSVAAALGEGPGRGKIVCIVSGGNIDAGKLTRILAGEIPA
jgi:threonine dehydratase